MAGAVLKRGGGRGGRRYVAMSEINVTPFVDVMLVLLIVFMVTAPLLTVGVPVDLPKASAPTISEQKEPITVSITAQGKIYLQEGRRRWTTSSPGWSPSPRTIARRGSSCVATATSSMAG